MRAQDFWSDVFQDVKVRVRLNTIINIWNTGHVFVDCRMTLWQLKSKLITYILEVCHEKVDFYKNELTQTPHCRWYEYIFNNCG